MVPDFENTRKNVYAQQFYMFSRDEWTERTSFFMGGGCRGGPHTWYLVKNMAYTWYLVKFWPVLGTW